MGIKNDLQKKTRIFYVRKRNLEKNTKSVKSLHLVAKVAKLIFFCKMLSISLITYTMIMERNQ